MIPMQYTKLTRQGMVGLLLVAIACGHLGCGLPVQWQNMASKLPEASPRDPVCYILCIWEPSEGHDPEGNHTRGFAGKICFFTRRQETPVRVNGDVQISVFDDQGQAEERTKPIHNWDFVGDAWKIHLHDGTFGPTYSVFIPYTRKGNHQAQCALRVRFTPENGQPIFSNTAAVILPGLLRKKDEEAVDAKPKTDPRTSLKSLTIPLKEKQKQRFSELRLGESSMERVVAPVSKLARRAARNGVTLPRPNALTGHEVSREMPSLPAPPPQTLPRAIRPAKPIQSNQPNQSKQPDQFHRTTTEIGFRNSSTTETPPVPPANSVQGKQPAQSHPLVQPVGTPPATKTGHHPLGDLGTAQSVQSGT